MALKVYGGHIKYRNAERSIKSPKSLYIPSGSRARRQLMVLVGTDFIGCHLFICFPSSVTS